MSVNDIGVEIVVLNKNPLHRDTLEMVKEMNMGAVSKEKVAFECKLDQLHPGVYEYGIRIYPANAALKYRQHFPLVKWI